MTENIRNEFPDYDSIEDVQQKFFLEELPSRENGRYLYRKRGLQEEAGAAVLFQCNGRIIAAAILTAAQRFEDPTEDGYAGCLYFNVESIRVFDPVGPGVLHEIWPEFRRFNQVRQNLEPNGYPEFERQLTGLRSPQTLPPTLEATDFAPPPNRVYAREYRILRDTELARRVKRLHRFECQLCGHTIELPNRRRYAESHHIQPLGQPHNGPDVIENIICVCPNHHAELDYGVSRILLPTLRRSDGHAVDSKYIDYHNCTIYKPTNI